MKETLLSLLKLAEIDNKIDQILEDQKEIPTTVKEISGDIISLQETINTSKTELAELEAKKKELDGHIVEKTEWANNREARINEIKTTKEYQAAAKEISLAKKEIKDSEKSLEDLTPQLEEKTAEAASNSEEYQPKIDELKAEINEFKVKFDSIKEVVAAEKKIRDTVVAEITNKQMLAYYERIHTRISPAIAKAENCTCTECGSRLLPQVFNLLAVGENIKSCSRCKRILYLDSVLHGETEDEASKA